MDLQMPVLDGFAATSRIRQDLRLPNLPIVAMTANAMASDREACIAVGMNDHVGKPFDLDHLVGVIRLHAGRSRLAADDIGAATLAADVLDAAAGAGIDIAAAIARLGGRHDLYGRMLRAFVNDLAGMHAQLEPGRDAEALAVGSLQRLLHTLKGLAATFGATALAARAAQAERTLAGDRSPNGARQIAASMRAEIERASPGILQLMHTMQQAGAQARPVVPTLPEREAVRRALRELAELLRNSDMDATLVHADLRRTLAGARDETLDALDESIAGLDFEQALVHCGELIEAYQE